MKCIRIPIHCNWRIKCSYARKYPCHCPHLFARQPRSGISWPRVPGAGCAAGAGRTSVQDLAPRMIGSSWTQEWWGADGVIPNPNIYTNYYFSIQWWAGDALLWFLILQAGAALTRPRGRAAWAARWCRRAQSPCWGPCSGWGWPPPPRPCWCPPLQCPRGRGWSGDT